MIQRLEWCGQRHSYPEPDIKGVSYPVTWADDGELYTSSGDPRWGETMDGLGIEKFSGGPTDYRITKVHPMNDYLGAGGDGPKPTGMICVDGILYLAVQNMRRGRMAPFSMRSQHGSDAQIIYSALKGAFWIPSFATIAEPMFPGHKFGGPAFINFGQNNAHARDAYVYAVSSDQWDNGSNLWLGRVSADRVMRREAWEWVCSFTPFGEPAWSHDLNESIPVLSLHRWLGVPEMVYLAGIRRYLLLTWRLRQDFSPDDGTDLIVLDAPEPWGPFTLVHFEEYWEEGVQSLLPEGAVEMDGCRWHWRMDAVFRELGAYRAEGRLLSVPRPPVSPADGLRLRWITRPGLKIPPPEAKPPRDG